MTVAVLVVAGLLAWQGIDDGSEAAGAYPPPAPITPDPEIAPVSPDAPSPTAAGVAQALAPGLDDPALGDLTGQVSDPSTGKVLWSADPDRPRTPASVNKLLTSSAALLALPRDKRITTAVVTGDDGRVVLVGGGDPTLTAQPEGTDGYYPDAAHIDELADQIRAAGLHPTGVDVDVSLYTGPALAQGWFDSDIAGGYIAPMQPIMIDGARQDVTNPDSPRSDTPALDAGKALAASLGLDADADGVVDLAHAPSGAEQVGSVQSAPMVELVRQLLVHSDNLLAEAVGRQVALATDSDPSFDGSAQAVLSTLEDAGFETGGAELHDSSGMSVDDALPARLIDDVLNAAAGRGDGGGDGGDDSGRAGDGHSGGPAGDALRPLLDAVPIAGGTGTLADRYKTDAQAGAGWVRAKTGTLSGVSTLAGVVTDADGRVLTFAFMSGGTAPADARPALDDLAAVLRGCGCRGG